MLAELRQKSQITIPKEIMMKLGLKEGDKFEVFEQGGEIHLIPVVVYQKQYLYELKNEIEEIKCKLEDKDQEVFDDINKLFKKLDE